jgi:hypothetical protein
MLPKRFIAIPGSTGAILYLVAYALISAGLNTVWIAIGLHTLG